VGQMTGQLIEPVTEGRSILPLARSTCQPHNGSMATDHPFSFKIEEDPNNERRFRWVIYEGEKPRERSPHSYATIRHARADAERFMQSLITPRIRKLPGALNARPAPVEVPPNKNPRAIAAGSAHQRNRG
jgi:hypothetical protein